MANNYIVSTHGPNREFTIPQVHALRTLYGCVVEGLKNAVPCRAMSNNIDIRLEDYTKLTQAVEKLNTVMKGRNKNDG